MDKVRHYRTSRPANNRHPTLPTPTLFKLSSNLKADRDQARLQAANLQVNLNNVTAQRDVAQHANVQIQGKLDTDQGGDQMAVSKASQSSRQAS